jgi:uncharacterized protein (DUF1501 family)
MHTRRAFLKTTALLSLAPTLPVFLARTGRAAEPEREGGVLVVVQLDGGNDALNTVVPHTDAEYTRLRPRLKLAAKDLVKLDDTVGLHPALRPLDALLQKGHLAVLPGVGYPNPTRSHFRSMAIWHTAKFDPEEHTGYGWLGRALDLENHNSVLIGGGGTPAALRGRRSAALSLAQPEDLVLSDATTARLTSGEEPGGDLLDFVRRQAVDGYGAGEKMAQITRDSGAAYPASGLAERLRLAAGLLKSGMSARVIYTLQSGYDTHASQAFSHANLLGEFGGAVRAFFADLEKAKFAERVLLLAFSEFGRTIKENGSAGTDHGTTGCVLVAGPRVKGGLLGRMPSLTDLEEGEPKMTTDFRRIYATVLDQWLNCPSEKVLGSRFEHLPLL